LAASPAAQTQLVPVAVRVARPQRAVRSAVVAVQAAPPRVAVGVARLQVA